MIMKNAAKFIAMVLVVSLIMIPCQMCVYADSTENGVAINKENFPDPLFRNFMLNGSHMIWDEEGNPVEVVYDANKDGWLSVEEAENIKQLLVMESYIRDLKGMENLTKLIEIDCQRSSVEKLYLENCPDLLILNCYRAQLKGTLDLSNNAKLEGAACHNNRELTAIDVSGCENLTSLTCGATGVTSLDFSNNPKLKSVSCEDTPIASLDFSNNPELTIVCAYNSALADIDISKNEKLQMLDVSGCDLLSLDVRNNNELIDLQVYGNNFAWFELGEKSALNVRVDDSIIELKVDESSFDITEAFPGIDPAKVTVVSGATLNGSILSGYTEGVPVIYNYNCGTSANGQVILNVTLNVTGYEASAVPGGDEDPVTPEEDKEPVTPEEERDPAVPETDKDSIVPDSEIAEPEKEPTVSNEIEADISDKTYVSVETGDESTILPWLVVMMVAGLIIVITLRKSV